MLFVVALTLGVVVVSAQNALDQLKTYGESGPAANAKGAPPGAHAEPGVTGGLPDVTGIKLGMPLREAYTILQTAHPKDHIDMDANNIPGINKPVLTEFRFEGAQEQVRVAVTPPPSQQVVWKIWRVLSQQKINHANVVSTLREKYGKESAIVPTGANEQQISEMWWFFDEQGRPGKPQQGNFANSIDSSNYCIGQLSRPSWVAAPNLPTFVGQRDPRFEWCTSSGIGIRALFQSQEIVGSLNVLVFNFPAAMRSGKAELDFINDVGKRQQQQQIDQSKQARPKL